jgi:hypothetical protein
VKVTVDSLMACGAEGPVSLMVLCIPALTRTGGTAVLRPNVRTVPSVVLTVVLPCSSTCTWKEVPWTVFVDVGVTTS